MDKRPIDDIFARAAGPAPPVDPALLDRISAEIGKSLHPVRPLLPHPVMAAGLWLMSMALATAGALLLGLYGVARLPAVNGVAIFSALAILAWLSAWLSAAEMMPGSRRPIGARTLIAIATATPAAIFGLLWQNYQTERFVPQGVTCLTAGLIQAAPVGLAAWLILRRGFAVNPVSAGLVTGTLASLAGVTMLELHCPNFEAPHVLVWHTAVVPTGALAGAVSAAAMRSRAAPV